jgi:hypothetical protein
MNSTIINAQRNAHIDNRMRLRFRCIEWEGDRGCLIDRFKAQYEVTVEDLCKECSGSLDVGEYVSGTVDGERITNILLETGPRAVGLVERKDFSGAGPYSEAGGGWEPRGTPDTGLRGGKPDSGRFSHLK